MEKKIYLILMNTDNKLMILGIGASLTAAYCAYKVASSNPKAKRPKKWKGNTRGRFKIRDVDGDSEEGLSDVDITIIDGEQTITNENVEQQSETSVPLSQVNYARQKQIIQQKDSCTVTSSQVTETVLPKRQNRFAHFWSKKDKRDPSLDSEEERFQQWQKQREHHLKTKNYVKNDEVYWDENVPPEEHNSEHEKKKLYKFIKDYKKSRLRNRSDSIRTYQKVVRRNNSEKNNSLHKLCPSEIDSVNESETMDSKPDSLLNMMEEKRENNFFDILSAISKPIVEDKNKKEKKIKRSRKIKKSNPKAFSEPEFYN